MKSDAAETRFDEARARLPQPSVVPAAGGVRLETLYLDGPSPPLVFLHGGLGNLWNFYPQLAHFAEKREVLAYSYAGNGNSEGRASYDLETHLADLAVLLERFSIAAPVLVGWSYGTEVALEYAKRHRVRALCLAAGGAYGITPQWELPFLNLALFTRAYRLLPSTSFLKALARKTMFHPSTPETVVDDVLRSNPLPRRRSAWRTVTEGFWNYDGRDGLDAITAPALVVHGPADRVVPERVARETARLLPAARFARIPESGHVLLAEQPRHFNQLLEGLLARRISRYYHRRL